MNRRKFIQSLSALGLAPVLPTGNLLTKALAAPVSVIAPASKYHCAEYKWAEILVRSHKSCSIDFLRRHLKVGPGQAENLQAELVRRGVITLTQDVYGLRRATKPLWDEYAPGFQERLKEKARQALEKLTETIEEGIDQCEELEATKTQEVSAIETAEEITTLEQQQNAV